ncbi:uncharacterized protein LOC103794109 [Callithrix jacchus]
MAGRSGAERGLGCHSGASPGLERVGVRGRPRSWSGCWKRMGRGRGVGRIQPRSGHAKRSNPKCNAAHTHRGEQPLTGWACNHRLQQDALRRREMPWFSTTPVRNSEHALSRHSAQAHTAPLPAPRPTLPKLGEQLARRGSRTRLHPYKYVEEDGQSRLLLASRPRPTPRLVKFCGVHAAAWHSDWVKVGTCTLDLAHAQLVGRSPEGCGRKRDMNF